MIRVLICNCCRINFQLIKQVFITFVFSPLNYLWNAYVIHHYTFLSPIKLSYLVFCHLFEFKTSNLLNQLSYDCMINKGCYVIHYSKLRVYFSENWCLNKIHGTNFLTPDAHFDNTCLFSDARGQNIWNSKLI